jgi:hypothetical protein
MGVGIRKKSREATTGPRKKIVMMADLVPAYSFPGIVSPPEGDTSSYGFWSSEKIE